MDNLEIFQRLGLAIAIGATVGIERHWRERDEEDGSPTAGIRTFTLIGMFGGVAALIDHLLAISGGIPGLMLIGFFVTFMAAFTLFQMREAIAEASFSVTSIIAAMLTFSLGALSIC
ncbi:MgtC/SapB family protein (plasmid) [Phyllobacterium sp. 628]|uniref:MgtC/SapB family protein n=1 Tax=Phyllobacterium sp. 628 TaxID=2718938 RepID=UPI001662257F|nr:MgtC/SapB family protein [Phyllobacterium sp. 628]QND54481.1 MgtC/SapB family protein [Phyllobacterium sp. 628]